MKAFSIAAATALFASSVSAQIDPIVIKVASLSRLPPSHLTISLGLQVLLQD